VNKTAIISQQAACFRLVYDTGGRYVNDHCFVVADDGLAHLFHIVGPVGKGCYDEGSEVSFGHAASADLESWRPCPDVLAADPNSAHEPDHIFAPYVLKKDRTFFMFYAGIDERTRRESICLATSGDLFHWSKHPFNPLFRPSRHWAEHDADPGMWGCCRDPHVLALPGHGYVLYFAAWIKDTGGRLVALGAAVSEDLFCWQDAGPVMIRERATEGATTSMESPCVIERGGHYYLFYKHRDGTRLVVSDDPLRFTDRQDDWFSCAHAAEILEIGGRWYISSCSRELTDVNHATSDRTKGLYLAHLEWEADRPAVRPFEPIPALGADPPGNAYR